MRSWFLLHRFGDSHVAWHKSFKSAGGTVKITLSKEAARKTTFQTQILVGWVHVSVVVFEVGSMVILQSRDIPGLP